MDNSTPRSSIFGNALRKFQEKPLFYSAATALSGVAFTGLYGLRKRKMRLSLYLINVRLAAQGSFVGILTLGIIYSLGKQHFGGQEEKSETRR